MIVLAVDKVQKRYGPEPVLDGVSFEVRPGDKVGLVGPNGTGKSTLLKIISGQLEADAGTVAVHQSANVGYLEQHPEFAPERTVWEEAHAALESLIKLAEEAEAVAHALSAAENEGERQRLAARFDILQHELHARDGYHLNRRIERVLQGLGFAAASYHQPVGTLSGGQQNRLLLARLLLAAPDLLLLDEPSNHLDLDATQWLEGFLATSRQALVVVSHDRYFLDRVTNRTLELFQGTTEAYVGNFSAYWLQKGERVEVQRRTYERQQEEIARLEEFVRRNFAGQKSAQAEDRRKKLERIDRVPPPRIIAAPPMFFPEVARSGDIVIRVEHLSKAFARPLFADLSFDVLRGQRWGILGPNGSGKTTLLRCLMGEHRADAGETIFGAGVKVGYFDQQLTQLDDEATVVDAIRPAHKEMLTPERRNLLARFGLTGDLAFQKVRSLSGGEKNRAALAMLAASDVNLLLLDEPTNHLDLWARDALENALKAFGGTVVFVSHDRYFLNRVCDRLLIVEPGRFRVVEGNYDTFLMLVERGLASEARSTSGTEATTRTAKAVASRDARGESSPAKRKRTFPYRKVPEIEAEIHERESRVEALHEQLGLADVLRDGVRMKETIAELDEQKALLAKLYEHWEEAVELN